MTEVDQEKLGELLSAYLDGELDDQQRQWVERLLKEDKSARRLYYELQQTSQLVATLPRQKAPSCITEELQLHQERDELLGEPIAQQINADRRRTPFKAILSIAASITVIVSGALWMTRENSQSQPGPGGDILAFAESDESIPNPMPLFEFDRRSRSAGKNRSSRKSAIQTLSGAKTASADTSQNKDLTAKLESGINVHAIQSHAFSAETLRLKLKVHDASDRDKLTAKLVKHFSRRKIQNLANTPGRSSMNSRSGSFFYQGNSAVNFTNKNQSQIIVRVPVEEMNNLLDELSREKDMDDRIELAAGPLTFQGLSQTRSLLQRHESAKQSRSDVKSDHESRRSQPRFSRRRSRSLSSKDKSDRQKKEMPEDDSFYDDLSGVLGLDRISVEKLLRETKSVAEDSATSPEEAMQIDADSYQTGVNKPMKIETPTTKTKVNQLKKLPNEPRSFITFVVELNIDKPGAKPPAKSNTRSSVKKKAKSKSQSKSVAQ